MQQTIQEKCVDLWEITRSNRRARTSTEAAPFSNNNKDPNPDIYGDLLQMLLKRLFVHSQINKAEQTETDGLMMRPGQLKITG